MNNENQLDVLVPAYNAETFIDSTLDSILCQTYRRFRVYLSVDKSDDKTLEKCVDLAKKDSRVQVIEQFDRLGWVGNCNFLLELITAPFAVFAFHDDILHPSYFDKLINALEVNTAAVNAFSDTLLTSTDGSTEHWVFSELESIDDPALRGIKILEQRGSWWVPNRGIFRVSAAKKIKGMKTHESGEFSADLPWLFHMSLYGAFVRIPETLCFKYYKSSSLSRSWVFSQKSRYDVLASCMREIWLSDVSIEIKLKLGVPLMNYLSQNYGKVDG